MPRDGAGVYTRPAGIDAVSGATIESTKYNTNVQDVEADLNVARPISAGGTGATTPAGAMTALGGELAAQLVANYDTFAFKAGSFSSAAGATSAPTADAAQGICYANAAGADFYLEARSLVTNVKYVRRKTAGSWGAWSADTDASKVAKAGDTMTGLLVLSADPGAALGAATKQYVDSKAGIITLTGDVTASGVGSVPATLATVNGNVGTFGSAAALPVITVNAKGLITGVTTAVPGVTSLTGDVTGTGPGATAATLATVNSNVGSFGSATAIPVVTVNAKGLVTAASTAAIPAGRWTLLNTLTASNSATLTDITSLTNAYNEYEIVLENVLPVSNLDAFRVRVRNSGTFQSGANTYAFMITGAITPGTSGPSVGTATYLPLSQGASLGVGSAEGGVSGSFRLSKPTTTNGVKHIWGQTIHRSTTQNIMNTIGGYWFAGNGAIDGLEFAYSAGNIASGVIRIYGR